MDSRYGFVLVVKCEKAWEQLMNLGDILNRPQCVLILCQCFIRVCLEIKAPLVKLENQVIK